MSEFFAEQINFPDGKFPLPDALEPPHPPELKRHAHDSLVRYATTFAYATGAPLEISGENNFVHINGNYVHTYLNLTSTSAGRGRPAGNGRLEEELFTFTDTKALFVDPRTLIGASPQTIGTYAARRIDAKDLPFKSPFQTAEVHIAAFNESVMPYINQSVKESDLPVFPLAAVSINLDGQVSSTTDKDKDGIIVNQSFLYLILPPEGRDVTKSLRIRDYEEWVASDDLMHPTSELSKATQALTADNLAWLRRRGEHTYDFSKAAKEALLNKAAWAAIKAFDFAQPEVSFIKRVPSIFDTAPMRQFQANVGRVIANANDSSSIRSPHDLYIDGQLLTGHIGSDGADMIERIIEAALSKGQPIRS